MSYELVFGQCHFELRKNGPGWVPLTAIYCRMVETGQRGMPVKPKIMSMPGPNWSVFDFFRWTWIMLGLVWLSTAMSPQARSVAILK